MGNINQLEFSSLKNGHEYKRDILWDGYLKLFKNQFCYLIVMSYPFLLNQLSSAELAIC